MRRCCSSARRRPAAWLRYAEWDYADQRVRAPSAGGRNALGAHACGPTFHRSTSNSVIPTELVAGSLCQPNSAFPAAIGLQKTVRSLGRARQVHRSPAVRASRSKCDLVANRHYQLLYCEHRTPHCAVRCVFSNDRLKLKRPFETPAGPKQGNFATFPCPGRPRAPGSRWALCFLRRFHFVRCRLSRRSFEHS